MSAMTRFLQKKLLDHTIGKANWTMPTTVYLALFTSNPGEDGDQTGEPSGNDYERVAITSAMGATTLATGKAVNEQIIQFPTASGAWGVCTHWGILDASSDGNMLLYGALNTAMNIGTGDGPPIAEGALEILFA